MYFDGIAFLRVELLYLASENPEFITTLARRLNQSRACAVLQSNLIAIKFGTAEAQRLDWALPCNTEKCALEVVMYLPCNTEKYAL